MVQEIVEIAQSYLYMIVASIVILLIGFGLGVLVKKLMKKLLKEIKLNNIMNKVGITYDLESIVSSIIMYLIYLITVVLSLNQLGITSIVLYIIIGAIFMLVVLTFLVGLKDIIPNFVGWLYLQNKGKLKEGKFVEIKEISGTIEKIGFLETEIKTDLNDLLYIPNSLFLKSKFKLKKN